MIDLNLNLNLSFSNKGKMKTSEISPPYDIHKDQKKYILDPFENWINSNKKRGLFLGFRKCGKTDLITIYSISKWILEDQNRTVIIMTRKIDRARAILRKIGENLQYSGLRGDFGQDQIRLTKNKQPTVLALTVNSTTKGWHADLLICDDPVEPTDEYSTAFKNRVDVVYREAKNISTKIFVIGQYVAHDDIYVKLEANKSVDLIKFWINDASDSLINILDLDLNDIKENLVNYGKNYEGVFYPDDDSPFSNILIGSYTDDYDYALLDPSNGKNDYSAFVYLKDYGDFLAIKGKMYKENWIDALEYELEPINNVNRFYYENNTIGASGYHFFKNKGIRAFEFSTTQNKVEKILSLTTYIKKGKIRLDLNSDKVFIDNVKNWSPKKGNNQVDDGIDALAMIVKKIGY